METENRQTMTKEHNFTKTKILISRNLIIQFKVPSSIENISIITKTTKGQ